MYALELIKGPWPEAEPYIMKHPFWAYRYAIFLLKKRWPEAEPYIKNGDIRSWGYYKGYFNIKD
jgi:hypothetical protein